MFGSRGGFWHATDPPDLGLVVARHVGLTVSATVKDGDALLVLFGHLRAVGSSPLSPNVARCPWLQPRGRQPPCQQAEIRSSVFPLYLPVKIWYSCSMKQMLTAKLKLHTTPEQFQKLRQTQLAYRDALNFVSRYAF